MLSINFLKRLVFISKPHANFRISHLDIQSSNFSNMFCEIPFKKDFTKSKKIQFSELLRVTAPEYPLHRFFVRPNSFRIKLFKCA